MPMVIEEEKLELSCEECPAVLSTEQDDDGNIPGADHWTCETGIVDIALCPECSKTLIICPECGARSPESKHYVRHNGDSVVDCTGCSYTIWHSSKDLFF